jgi:hypothetical protein
MPCALAGGAFVVRRRHASLGLCPFKHLLSAGGRILAQRGRLSRAAASQPDHETPPRVGVWAQPSGALRGGAPVTLGGKIASATAGPGERAGDRTVVEHRLLDRARSQEDSDIVGFTTEVHRACHGWGGDVAELSTRPRGPPRAAANQPDHATRSAGRGLGAAQRGWGGRPPLTGGGKMESASAGSGERAGDRTVVEHGLLDRPARTLIAPACGSLGEGAARPSLRRQRGKIRDRVGRVVSPGPGPMRTPTP